MHLEFWRASTPSELRLEDCCLCEQQFQTRSVVAMAFDLPGGREIGVVCPTCIWILGHRAPGRFWTLAEYYAALRRYPRPIWSTDEEADAELDALGWEVPDLWRVERCG
jgi:hypothetical protein